MPLVRTLAATIFLPVALLKAGLYFADHDPSFFLGDSASYLLTATDRWIPTDRSFVYGFLIRILSVRHFHSLTPVLVFQTALGGLASVVLAWCLLHIFRAPRWVAVTAALLFAVEPLEWASEHFIMTEAIANFLLALYLAIALSYALLPRVWKLLPLAVLAFCMVSIRASNLPFAVALSALLPLAALLFRYRRKSVAVLSIHLALSIGGTQVALFAYRHWCGHVSHMPPGYIYQDGLFLIGDWLPIVEPQDFPIPELRHPIFDNPLFPLTMRSKRAAERWMDGGVVARMIRLTPNHTSLPQAYIASQIAGATAFRAARRNPTGLLALTALTFADYWRWPYMIYSVEDNQGFLRPLTPELERCLLERFHYRYDMNRNAETLSKRWERAALPWYFVLLVTPVLFFVSYFFVPPQYRGIWLLLLVSAAIYVGIACCLVEKPTVRYLQPVGWIALLGIGAFTGFVQNRVQSGTAKDTIGEAGAAPSALVDPVQ